MVNWLQEVEQRQEALFEDLFRLLRIPSVREDDKATPEAPVGPGPKAALEEFLIMATEDGFETTQFGPWAGRIEIGSGAHLVGILGHVDVVPTGTGWETDPFEPVIKDDRIYARGASDDKGPTVAAYFAIKLLRELGYEFNQRLHLIVGTDEESGWQCMDHYFKHAEMPDYGFSPDAVFPIINGEKGNVSAHFDFEAGESKEGAYSLVSFKSGLRENMVPQEATAIIKTANIQKATAAFDAYLATHREVKGTYTVNGDDVTFEMTGKAAHGSTPEAGINAATYLAEALSVYDFDTTGAHAFIQIMTDYLHASFDGAKLGVETKHDVMGALSMNIGIANFALEQGGEVIANFRYPVGTDAHIIGDKIAQTVNVAGVTSKMGDFKEPHYVPADDPMVKTLLDVYERQTGFEGHEMSIGGGTYGRLMPRGVAFGALFPDSIDTMHQANEFLAIQDLVRATAIYAEAIYLLTR